MEKQSLLSTEKKKTKVFLPDLNPTREASKELAKKLSERWTKEEEAWRFFYLKTDEYALVERTAQLACDIKFINPRRGARIRAFEEIYDEYMKAQNPKGTKPSSHLAEYRSKIMDFLSDEDAIDDGNLLFIHMKCNRADIDKAAMYKYNAFIHKLRAELQELYIESCTKADTENPIISPHQQIVFLFWGTECDFINGPLKEQIYTIQYPSLDASDFEKLLKEYHERSERYRHDYADEKSIPYEKIEFKGEKSLYDWYANRMTGISELQARKILLDCKALFQGGRVDYTNTLEIESAIIAYKNKVLEKHNLLEIVNTKLDHDVYGLDHVADWLVSHKEVIGNAQDAPTGFLLVGLPGTGKSATAKMAANKLKLPLVRLEMANILGGYVGDSEKNMKKMLEDLKFAAPCILWIDEIEKALSGSDNKDGGNGVVQRLFGMLLTFIQENKRPVFIVTTANDISKLPPEFFRNGRFDQTFSVMMPDYKGCCQITRNLLKYYNKKLGGKQDISEETARNVFDACTGTREKPRFLTGADIEAHIKELYWDYQKKKKTFSDNERKLGDDMCSLSKNMKVLAVPDSSKSMKMLASSYLDMMQRGMTMAGSQDTVFKTDKLDLDAVRFYEYEEGDMKLPSCILLSKEENENYANRRKSKKAEEWYDVVFFDFLTEAMGEVIIFDEGDELPETKAEYIKLKRAIRKPKKEVADTPKDA